MMNGNNYYFFRLKVNHVNNEVKISEQEMTNVTPDLT